MDRDRFLLFEVTVGEGEDSKELPVIDDSTQSFDAWMEDEQSRVWLVDKTIRDRVLQKCNY